MWREVARFEAQLQRREFLTWVYVAVFFFLTFGYTSSDAVELVTGRGAVAKNAPWALAHAMAGVTAFGQVITTMITATAVMRDVAIRQQELLFTTRLTRGDYLVGRWGGALAVMLAVYAAIPAGLLLGTAMPWVDPATLQPFSAAAFLRPLALLVVPNVVVVSALFFTAGALGRSFMTILLLGVGLVALWTTGVALARDGVALGALLDPFGNAAVELVTRDWRPHERAVLKLPASEWLVANRVLWLSIGGAALALLVRRFRFETMLAPTGASRVAAAMHAEPHTPSITAFAADRASTPAPLRPPVRLTGRVGVVAREAWWTLRWTLRERGFLTLAFLGALNALANAWRAGGAAPHAGDILGAVQEHSRVFLILVATIYAGELVWRERDVRTDAQRDVLPVGTGVLVTGKVTGLLAAQLALVAPLVLVALAVGWGRGAEGMGVGLAFGWIGGFVFPFLAQLTLLSLLVHAVVQHKVAGHVLLILGWVLAVALERSVPVPPLARYANLPSFTWGAAEGFGGMGGTLVAFVLYWSALAAACAVLASVFWVRGVPAPLGRRVTVALRRLRGVNGVVLVVTLAAAWVIGVRVNENLVR